MFRLLKIIFLLSGVICIYCEVSLAPATSSPVKLIPRQLLFGNPVKANPQISPDGNYLAYLAPVKNVMNIWVRAIDAQDDRPVTKDKNRGIQAYFWAQDSRHIFYVQDTEGNENWRLYSVEIGSGNVKEFTPYKDVQVRILEHDKHFPDEVLLEMNQRNPAFHDVYHLNLATGEMKLIEQNPGNVADWLVDTQLKIRGALAAHDDGSYDLLIRRGDKLEWEKLLSWDSDNALSSGAISFSEGHQFIYLRDSRQADTARLVKLHIESGKLEVLAEDKNYDVGGVMIHPDTYEIQMAGFNKERREWVILDPSLKADIEAIGELDTGDFFISSRDNSLKKWVIGFNKDNGPVAYYLYDQPAKRGTFLFSVRPDLEAYTLAAMKPVSFIARDGFTIHGYLTIPPGAAPEKLPLVVNVHGGPWVRSAWGYDPEAQWLANRGYGALDINYRGSTGYGKAFLNAGNKEWGRKMHEDLVDGVHWAVKEGIADPEKVAIFGGSYGGYAALVGATFTPDLFRCAVSIVGPSNLVSFIRSVPPYWQNYLATFYRRVGNPDTEEEFLKSRSPLFKVDQIKIPVLIAQGANDPRVKRAESEQIVEAMKEKGIDYKYLLFPDEGHGFVKARNRLKFYAEAEEFLAKHLGGRFEK